MNSNKSRIKINWFGLEMKNVNVGNVSVGVALLIHAIAPHGFIY